VPGDGCSGGDFFGGARVVSRSWVRRRGTPDGLCGAVAIVARHAFAAQEAPGGEWATMVRLTNPYKSSRRARAPSLRVSSSITAGNIPTVWISLQATVRRGVTNASRYVGKPCEQPRQVEPVAEEALDHRARDDLAHLTMGKNMVG